MVRIELPAPQAKAGSAPTQSSFFQRQPLRAKTGCLRCRTRRKKCDEVKPVCGDCTRLRFACIWPAAGGNARKGGEDQPIKEKEKGGRLEKEKGKGKENEAPGGPVVVVAGRGNSHSHAARISVAMMKSSPPLCRSPPGEIQAISRNQTENCLFQEGVGLLQYLVCPTADPSCRDFSALLVVLKQEPWIEDSLLAFASSVVQNLPGKKALGGPAAKLYHSAVVGLRRNFVDLNNSDRQRMLLVSANFLGLLEVCYLCFQISDT
jgi:hypothetical protein